MLLFRVGVGDMMRRVGGHVFFELAEIDVAPLATVREHGHDDAFFDA